MNEHVTTGSRPAAYQDVLDAPAHMVAELIRGSLHLHPRPASPHARAASMLGVEIGAPFERGRPEGWRIVFEPEPHLGDEVLAPDLAGWRRGRMPACPDASWFDLALDWVCEVLSPGTRRIDLTDKRDIYGAQGVAHPWFVDPEARNLGAFERRVAAWTLPAALKDDAEVRLAPVDAVASPLSALWTD